MCRTGLDPRLSGWIQFGLLLPILYWNRSWFINGVKTLCHGAPSMDTLVAMGSGTGAVYSLLRLLSIAPGGVEHLSFDASGMILVLVTVGKYLEDRTKRHAADAIAKLVRLTPDEACVEIDGKEVICKVKDLKPGCCIIMRPGDRVPVDGIILDGTAVLDESAMTGESLPVVRKQGERVCAGTVNVEGFFRFEAQQVGKDTTLAKIIALVTEAGTNKLRISRIADKVSAVFVPAVLILAVIVFTVWMLLGAGFPFALSTGITVLLISCPCALGLATPLAVMAGAGRGAEHGILFRNGETLETLGKIDVMVFDKTGTLTKGKPAVTAVYPAPGITEEHLLSTAATLETKSRHPYARAILDHAETKKITPENADDFQLVPGRGIRVVKEGRDCYGGNRAFLLEQGIVLPEEGSGTPLSALYFAEGTQFLGCLVMADELRDDSAKTIQELKEMHIEPVMLTGDHETTAAETAAALHIARWQANTLPDGKEEYIRQLHREGRIVAMTGDGINDAPALARADAGIAINGGTDIAIGSAGVILMQKGLSPAAEAVRISRAVVRNIKINLFWAFAYNVLAIPLAAGVFYPVTGWLLPPAAGAAAMCASSLCVVLNALRLRKMKL